MWVYFNVPEARYLEYRAGMDQDEDHDDGAYDDDDDDDDDKDDEDDEDEGEGDDDAHEADDDGEELSIEMVLANGKKFDQHGEISAIEADFNNETGNIAFRADFPNPTNLLRHGQTGSVLIHRVVHDAVVIPQRATFEILDKRYVFLVGEDDVVHQHEIKVQHEMEDIFVIEDGVKEGDKIVLEGVRQVRDGEKVEFEFRDAKEVLSDLKFKAE
jgi:membrane fusion protein (multidrug efflux system)